MGANIEDLILNCEEVSEELIRKDFGEDRKNIGLIVEAFKHSKEFFEGIGKTRDCGNPYFIHQYAVAKILHEAGATDETIIVGLLHDVLEEAKGRAKEEKSKIEEKFGPEIANLVDVVSTDFSTGFYNERIENLFKVSDNIKNGDEDKIPIKYGAIPVLVKLADAIDNIETNYASRRDLYSKGLPSIRAIRREPNKGLKWKKYQHRLDNAFVMLSESRRYLNGKDCLFKEEITQLYQRLRDSVITQIRNEVYGVNREISALRRRNKEEYKKAALKTIFGKKNGDFLERNGYDIGKIRANIQDAKEMPIKIPRHKYALKQIDQGFDENVFDGYAKAVIHSLRSHRWNLIKKVIKAYRIPKNPY